MQNLKVKQLAERNREKRVMERERGETGVERICS